MLTCKELPSNSQPCQEIRHPAEIHTVLVHILNVTFRSNYRLKKTLGDNRMARENAIDLQRLWELTHEGKSAQEIMQELDLHDINAVNSALEEMMHAKGLMQRVTSPSGETPAMPRYMHDGIRLTPAMLSDKGFKPGDRFRLTVEKNRIILDKEP
jgi:hypothetical protein